MSVYLLEVETRIIDELRRKIAIWMVVPFPEIGQMEGHGQRNVKWECRGRETGSWSHRSLPSCVVSTHLPGLSTSFAPYPAWGSYTKSSTMGTWCFFTHSLSLPAFPLPISLSLLQFPMEVFSHFKNKKRITSCSHFPVWQGKIHASKRTDMTWTVLHRYDSDRKERESA